MNIIMAIALWCGQPYAMTTQSEFRSAKQVQACREKLLKCTKDKDLAERIKCFEAEGYQ